MTKPKEGERLCGSAVLFDPAWRTARLTFPKSIACIYESPDLNELDCETLVHLLCSRTLSFSMVRKRLFPARNPPHWVQLLMYCANPSVGFPVPPAKGFPSSQKPRSHWRCMVLSPADRPMKNLHGSTWSRKESPELKLEFDDDGLYSSSVCIAILFSWSGYLVMNMVSSLWVILCPARSFSSLALVISPI